MSAWWAGRSSATSIYDVESDWTFGSPSVFYLYYRESALSDEGIYTEETQQILNLYKTYSSLKEELKRKHFPDDTNVLSEREMEIAVLAAEGLTNSEIAERLYISANTVKAAAQSTYTAAQLLKKQVIITRHIRLMCRDVWLPVPV
ncbi:MAG: helix-turn-helix transcriptional regulator [Syntrophomonadaceae bacterium]|nr:helix-turn-helix transcriptional regulator [Syntrophomonadaceae bacterium]